MFSKLYGNFQTYFINSPNVAYLARISVYSNENIIIYLISDRFALSLVFKH